MNFHPGIAATLTATNTLHTSTTTVSAATATITKPKMGKKKSDIYSCFQILPVKNKANKSIFMCKFCDRQYLQNATKMESHIVTQCQKVPPEVRISYAKVPGGGGSGSGSGGRHTFNNNNNNSNSNNHSPAASDNNSSESRPDTPNYLSQMAAANRARAHHHHQNQQQQQQHTHQVKRSTTGSPSAGGGGINLVVKRGAGGTLVAHQQVSSSSSPRTPSQQQQQQLRGNSDQFVRNSVNRNNSNSNSPNKRARLLMEGVGGSAGISVNVNHLNSNNNRSRMTASAAANSNSKYSQLKHQNNNNNNKQSNSSGAGVGGGGGGSSGAITTGSYNNSLKSISNSRSPHSSSTQYVSSVAVPSKLDQTSTPNATIDHKELLEIWRLLARGVYATGCPVSLFDNEHWKQAFRKIRPGLTLPTTDAVSTSLLKEEYARVRQTIHTEISECNFVTLQCESHLGNSPEERILSFFVSTPAPVLYRIVQLPQTEEISTKDKVLEAISSTIDSIGYTKVLAFISDVTSSSSDTKLCWEALRSKYPGLITFGCIFKGLNSLLDEFLEKPSIRELCRKGKCIVDGTKGSSVLKKRFQEIQRQLKLAPVTGFKFSSKSKWSSLAKCLALLNSQKAAFKQLVKCEESKEEFELQMKANEDVGDNMPLTFNDLLKNSDEPEFWDGVKSITNIIVPLSNWIKIMEPESSPSISQLPQIFHELKLAFENNLQYLPQIPTMDFFLKQLALLRRLCVNELHYAACLLNPKLKSKGILTEDEEEEASEFIHYFCETRDFDAHSALKELGNYRKKSGDFGISSVWKSAQNLDPVSWWNSIGPGYALGTVAVHLLEVAPSLSTFDPKALVGAAVPSNQSDIDEDKGNKLALIKHHLQFKSSSKKSPSKPLLVQAPLSEQVISINNHTPKEVEWLPQPDFKLEDQEPMDVTQFLSQNTRESHRNIYSDSEEEEEEEALTEDTKNNNVITLDNANATSILSNLMRNSSNSPELLKNGQIKKVSPNSASPPSVVNNKLVNISANTITHSNNNSNADEELSSSSSSSDSEDGSSSSSSSSSNPTESSNNLSTL